MNERICLLCGCRQTDHIPPWQALKAWWLHRPYVMRAHIAAWVKS